MDTAVLRPLEQIPTAIAPRMQAHADTTEPAMALGLAGIKAPVSAAEPPLALAKERIRQSERIRHSATATGEEPAWLAQPAHALATCLAPRARPAPPPVPRTARLAAQLATSARPPGRRAFSQRCSVLVPPVPSPMAAVNAVFTTQAPQVPRTPTPASRPEGALARRRHHKRANISTFLVTASRTVRLDRFAARVRPHPNLVGPRSAWPRTLRTTSATMAAATAPSSCATQVFLHLNAWGRLRMTTLVRAARERRLPMTAGPGSPHASSSGRSRDVRPNGNGPEMNTPRPISQPGRRC
jgi:hypothetical protein